MSFLSLVVKSENVDPVTITKDYEQAALAFAKCYERCNSAYYKVRQKNAKIAYDYFVI